MYDRTSRLAHSLIADRHEAARADRSITRERPSAEAEPRRSEARPSRAGAIGHAATLALRALGHGLAHRPARLGHRS
jgi:hypothetical protein